MDKFKKRGTPFAHRKPQRGKVWKDGIVQHIYRLLGPIAVPFRKLPTNLQEVINIMPIFDNCSPSKVQRGRGLSWVAVEDFKDQGVASPTWQFSRQASFFLSDTDRSAV
jgi:hypothetical protein